MTLSSDGIAETSEPWLHQTRIISDLARSVSEIGSASALPCPKNRFSVHEVAEHRRLRDPPCTFHLVEPDEQADGCASLAGSLGLLL